MSRRSSRYARCTPHRIAKITLGALIACLLALPATSALADHPGDDPNYVGEFRAFATANGVECWVAEESVDHQAEIWFLYWVAIECPDYDGDEVEQAEDDDDTEYSAEWTVHASSRIERFESGKIVTGTDTMSRRWGYRYSVPAGWLVNYSQLWVSDGSSWWVCKDSGFTYSFFTTSLWAPSFNWGFAPCGQARWYANWGGGYQWTGSSWNSRWVWSGIVHLPCILCMTAPDAPNAPPPLPETGKTKGIPHPPPKGRT